GNGDGTFGAKTDLVTGSAALSVAIGDLDGDGKADLAVANFYSDNVSVLLGNGDGTFRAKADCWGGAGPGSLAIGDLNGDGAPDLALVCLLGVSVLPNTRSSVTPTLLSFFQGAWSSRGIELRWRFGDGTGFVATTLERSSSPEGPWSDVEGERRVEGMVVTVLDANVEPGRTYYYRLRATKAGGKATTFGPFAVTAGGVAEDFALLPITPNPSRSAARLEFTVPRTARVRLSVLDVQGRQIAVLADGVHEAGRYQVVWGGSSDRGQAAAGLYFARYEVPGRTAVRRFVLQR
ncbi:MAG TPA: T9SS type A sorting domain-containing protein, partial [Candidatus Eisenbacteria bacterium]